MKALLLFTLVFSSSLYASIDMERELAEGKIKAMETIHLQELTSQLDQKIQRAQALINMITQSIHSDSKQFQKREDIEYALVGHIAKLQAIRYDRTQSNNMNYETIEGFSKRINGLLKDLQTVTK